MSILKIRQHRQPPKPPVDPYELLWSDDEAERPARRFTRPEFWGLVALGVTAVFFMAMGVYWHASRSVGAEGDAPFAYFEVKAIDPSGHPVAGARVASGGQTLGVTDSFGEWRRFMRVSLGVPLSITITKSRGETTLQVTKNLAVPGRPPEEGDIEIKDRVRLQPAGQLRAQTGEAKVDPAEGAPAPSQPKDVTRVAFFVKQPIGPSGLRRKGQRNLGGDLVPALRARARQEGLTVDREAPWRVTVREVFVDPGKAAGHASTLLHVDSHYAKTEAEPELMATFLRNFDATSQGTADRVFGALREQVERSYEIHHDDGIWKISSPEARMWSLKPRDVLTDRQGQNFAVVAVAGGELALATKGRNPCSSRRAARSCRLFWPGLEGAAPSGQRRQKLRVFSSQSKPPRIYAAGDPPLTADGDTYEVWASPHGANLTIIQGNSVVYRGRVSFGEDKTPMISLPSKPLSHR